MNGEWFVVFFLPGNITTAEVDEDQLIAAIGGQTLEDGPSTEAVAGAIEAVLRTRYRVTRHPGAGPTALAEWTLSQLTPGGGPAG